MAQQQYNQWGEPVDQWGNPVGYGGAYLPPEYYDPNQTPYVDGGYGGQDPYYGGTNPTPAPAPNPPSGDPYTPAPTQPSADPTNPTAFISSLLANVPYGPDGLLSVRSQLEAAGYKLWVDANGGARGIITAPNGQTYNVLDPAESMNWWDNKTGTQWNVRNYQAGGGGGSAAAGNESVPEINPEYLQPWTEATPNLPSSPQFKAPGDFNAPTSETILQDPSYLFRVGQGEQALESSAAARGTINSGGTLKDILNYGQNAASQEYSNIWGRNFDKWNADWGNALTAFRAQKDTTDTDYGRALGDWTTRRDTYYANQSNPWEKILGASRIGAGF